ncbi:hypothetical protein ES703_123960 [subsurface metagenome]
MYRGCWQQEEGENSFLPQIKNNKGFTLIAALITVAIIIILTGIALVQFQKASNKAKVNKAETEIEIMGRAIEQIEEDTGNYLKKLEQLDDATPPSSKDKDSFSPWWGPYVSSLPVENKDPWGTIYVYLYWVSPRGRGKGREFHYPPGWSSPGERKGWGGNPLPPGLWRKLVGEGDLPDNGFLILSAGPDGEIDTEDDIVYGTY